MYKPLKTARIMKCLVMSLIVIVNMGINLAFATVR